MSSETDVWKSSSCNLCIEQQSPTSFNENWWKVVSAIFFALHSLGIYLKSTTNHSNIVPIQCPLLPSPPPQKKSKIHPLDNKSPLKSKKWSTKIYQSNLYCSSTNHIKVIYKIYMQTKHLVYSNKQLFTIVKAKNTKRKCRA